MSYVTDQLCRQEGRRWEGSAMQHLKKKTYTSHNTFSFGDVAADLHLANHEAMDVDREDEGGKRYPSRPRKPP